MQLLVRYAVACARIPVCWIGKLQAKVPALSIILLSILISGSSNHKLVKRIGTADDEWDVIERGRKIATIRKRRYSKMYSHDVIYRKKRSSESKDNAYERGYEDGLDDAEDGED